MFDLSDLPRPIIRYAAGLWRRRWLLAAGAWAFALLGWFGVWLLPDRYESRAQVYVQTESILEPVMTGVTARPNYQERVEVMRLQLLTRPNVAEIIYRAGLDANIEARSELDRRAKMEKLIDWVASEIKVESPSDMYFVITYLNGDPAVARNVVDAVLNLFIEQDLGASLAEKEEARRLLDEEIRKFDERLTAKEREVADFRRANADELAIAEGNLRRREMRESELARLGDQLAQEERRVITLENQLAATQRRSAGNELDQLKVQLAQLRSQYTESYPDIQNLKGRIESLENGAVGALPENPDYVRLQNELNAARVQVAGLKSQQESARAELEALTYTIGQAPGVGAELQRIVRDYEQTQKSYEELAQRRDRLALTASLGVGGQGVEYKVYERPQASIRPAAPPRLLLIFGVLLLAFAAAAAGVGLLVWLDRSYSQAADLRDAFGLPVLGSIGVVRSDALKTVQRRDLLRLAAACAGLAAVAVAYTYFEVVRLPSDPEAGGAQTASLAANGESR